MSSSESPLALFHTRLDTLLKLVRRYVKYLEEAAKRDDAIMELWITESSLSQVQIGQRTEFEEWAVKGDWNSSAPEKGAKSFTAWKAYRFSWDGEVKEVHEPHEFFPPELAQAHWEIERPFYYATTIRKSFISCREAAGYGPSAAIPQQALHALHESLEGTLPQIAKRLFEEWPRPGLGFGGPLALVEVNCWDLQERKLDEVVARHADQEVHAKLALRDKNQRFCGELFPTWNNRDIRILIAVVFELAQCYGDEPFCLACHAGASQFARLGINKDHKWIYRRLQSLTQERILVCVDRGKAGVPGERRAVQFRWVWTMKDRRENDIDALLEGL